MAWAAIDPGERNGIDDALAIGAAKAEYHLCEQIPGCNFSRKDEIWRVPLTWPAWVAFRTVWASQPIAISPKLEEWGAAQWEHVQHAYELRKALDCGERLRTELDEIEGGKRLFPFQRGGVAWLTDTRLGGRVILEDPQGNGKTPQVIRSIQVLAAAAATSEWVTSPLPALVICPGAALYGWAGEFETWAPELKVSVIDGTALKRRQAIEGEQADVYLIAWPNVRLHTRLARYPGTSFVKCDDHGGSQGKTVAQCEVHDKELNAIEWGLIVADEAHRMKDARSKQTRAVWHLMHHAPYAWPVTGTPVSDNIGDLWPILHALSPQAFPAKSRYLDLYAITGYAWGGKGTEVLDIRPDTAAAFHASVQPLMRRIPKEIARPQQPARLPAVFRYPEMTPSQARPYRQLKKELLAELDGRTTVPANDVVKFGRMCQLAASSIEITDGEDAQGFTRERIELVLPSSKADDLIDFLADNPGQLVVAANSPRLVALCEHKLALAKISNCKITGGMTAAQQHAAVEMFQKGDCRVIFLTSAGAESITLTAADTVLFIQPNPSYRDREQVIGRVDRIGQANAVRVVYSISPGTVEERLYQLGCEKEERAMQVTRDADLMAWILGKDQDNGKPQAPHAPPEPGQEQLPFQAG